jgi:hypothetical protein
MLGAHTRHPLREPISNHGGKGSLPPKGQNTRWQLVQTPILLVSGYINRPWSSFLAWSLLSLGASGADFHFCSDGRSRLRSAAAGEPAICQCTYINRQRQGWRAIYLWIYSSGRC